MYSVNGRLLLVADDLACVFVGSSSLPAGGNERFWIFVHTWCSTCSVMGSHQVSLYFVRSRCRAAALECTRRQDLKALTIAISAILK